MRALFARSFSTVHVHFVPLDDHGPFGNPYTIHHQNQLLARRIKDESRRVQDLKAQAYTRFDARQLSFAIDFAFKHLASGTAEPFDFGQCRQRLKIPDSAPRAFQNSLDIVCGTISPEDWKALLPCWRSSFCGGISA